MIAGILTVELVLGACGGGSGHVAQTSVVDQPSTHDSVRAACHRCNRPAGGADVGTVDGFTESRRHGSRRLPRVPQRHEQSHRDGQRHQLHRYRLDCEYGLHLSGERRRSGGADAQRVPAFATARGDHPGPGGYFGADRSERCQGGCRDIQQHHPDVECLDRSAEPGGDGSRRLLHLSKRRDDSHRHGRRHELHRHGSCQQHRIHLPGGGV